MFGLGTFLGISWVANNLPIFIIAGGAIILSESIKGTKKSEK